MKAVVLEKNGKHGKLAVKEYEKPVPAKGEVCVRIHASALNRRDYWISKGQYPDIQLPCIPGSDGAGVVESAGVGVDAEYIGKEVIIYPVFEWGDDPRIQGEKFRILGMPDNGTFAEFICVPQENVFYKPPHLDMAQTAAISLAGLTAWRALVTKAMVRQGEIVLITGIGGGVATMALLWAAGLGARVVVTSSSDEKIGKAIELGALDGFNYKNENWDSELRGKHGGVDAVIDGNFGPLFQPCFDSLMPGGRYIVFGFTQGRPAQGLDAAKLFFRQLKIEGTTMSTADEFRAMLEFVSEKKIKPVIDKSFNLGEAVEALEHIGSGKQMGKIVLDHLS